MTAQGPRKGESSSRFFAERSPDPTRAHSPRQLPTDHDHAVPTRAYQRDQSSRMLLGCHRPCCPKRPRGTKPTVSFPLESPFFPSGKRMRSRRMTAGMAEERQAQGGGGNDGPWTPRKTKGRFSSVPTALGNRTRRDFHIPTAPTMRPVEKWKSKGRISTFPPARFLFSSKPKPKKGGLEAGRFAPASRLILQ